MTSILCPVCGGELKCGEKTYICPAGHSFDRAKSGYVNLLMASGKGKRHGDDKLMVKARADFLSMGFYDRLSREIADASDLYSCASPVVVDAGCGEGKYTEDVYEKLILSGKKPDIIGVDISKDALSYAAKRLKGARFLVSSSADMPLRSRSADIILNIFSPFTGDEFSRVLKDGGKLIRVYPLRHHLWELKELIYDRAYENPETDMEEDGFFIIEKRQVRYTMELASNREIMSLFLMTPYYYKTGQSDQEKARRAEKLTVRAEFGIVIYGKK